MMKKVIAFPVLIIVLLSFFTKAKGQAYLSTNGTAIINESGDTVILKAMGLGGWMIQEGYMLQTSGFATAQYQIREKIESLIGKTETDLFYEEWLNNHVRKADIDSLKSWGFNAVRLPMHYNLFTLPVEDEPVPGENTWLTRGFQLTDSLVKWCSANEIYVILDLHAAPGGQGYEQGISDYNPAKPSLWESPANQAKTASLWKKIAERYTSEEWVAGYDLINEPNWNMTDNIPLKILYSRIADSIRKVDPDHILFIEGNWFANDFNGLTPPFIQNIVYSPHKYWSVNDQESIQWVLDIRDTHNVPIFFGEAGENSNVWFRNAIRLLEDNKIGWAMWPLKKVESISCPLSVKKTDSYQALLDYWNGTGPAITADSAKTTLMELAENIKIENCVYQKDVIDAMFRQVRSDETLPFKKLDIPGIIYASDYDMGVVGKAYFDLDLANYQVTSGNYTAWNRGWMYRNDGVDIEAITDTVNTNGFNVGWIDTGEWMKYQVNVNSDAIYDLKVRVASAEANGRFHFESDGAFVTSINSVQNTGGWKKWMTILIPNIVLSQDVDNLKFIVDAGVFNLSSFEFVERGPTTSTPASMIYAVTTDEHNIQISINKPITGTLPDPPSDFVVYLNGSSVPVTTVAKGNQNSRIIDISVDTVFKSDDIIKLSYTGNLITAFDGTMLATFILRDVKNTMIPIFNIPGKVEAEDYASQVGIQLETTTDAGGGQNIGYLDVGDYADYWVYNQTAGTFKIAYRTASESAGGKITLQEIDTTGKVTVLHTVEFPSTGGWQTWTTTYRNVYLKKGLHHLRMLISESQFNVNWFDFSLVSSVKNNYKDDNILIYPNPGDGIYYLRGDLDLTLIKSVSLYNSHGGEVVFKEISASGLAGKSINLTGLSTGVYLLGITYKDGHRVVKRIVHINR